MKKGDLRVGIGYDIHPLVEGRPLILGGVKIEHERGLAGHSDADALVHALCDALLGALGAGDLGEHFPETEEFEGISSLEILAEVSNMAERKGCRLVNADCIVHAEGPRLSVHRGRMAENISGVLSVPPGCISIKATTGEGMDSIGEGRAIAATAVVLLERVK